MRSWKIAAVALVIGLGATGTVGVSRARARDAYGKLHRLPVMSAVEQLRQRDLQIAGWQTALAADPASAIALGQLAGLYLQRGRESGNYDNYSQAEAYARRSLALRKQRNGMTYVTLASSLLAQHKFVEARDAALKLIAAEPDTPEYRALLGETQLELGEYDAAATSFGVVRAFSDRLSIAPRLARWAELQGRTKEARALLNAARTAALARGNLPPEQLAWFYLRAGELEMREGNTRAANRAFTAGLKLVPDDFRLLSAMARLENTAGHYGRAIQFGEASVAERMDPVTLATLSDAYSASGDSARAAEYASAMEVVVSGQPGPYHRAWSLFLLDHDERIPEVRARAQEELTSRRDIYGYDIYGWALFKEHRYAEARMAADSALKLGTRDASILYHAGMIEHMLGDDATARGHLSQALGLHATLSQEQVRTARDAMRGRP